MKIGILGDIHGNLEALEAVLADAKEQRVDRFICTGDVVGYNANPHECVEIIRNLDCLSVVQGNHDYYVANEELMIGFNPSAILSIKWTREQLTADERQWLRDLPLTGDIILPNPPMHFSVVHGSLDHPQIWPYVSDEFSAENSMNYQWTSLCFVGHTHVPITFVRDFTQVEPDYSENIILENDKKYLINVGSVGQPRDCNPLASYAIYEVEIGLVRIIRVDYDIETTQNKILEAGLPTRCATRLSYGQ